MLAPIRRGRSSNRNGLARALAIRPATSIALLRSFTRARSTGELVPAQPRHGVRLPRDLLDARTRFADGRIACAVAVPVVDGLEPVHVDVQDAERAGLPVDQGEALPEMVVEQRPVGQAGQGVVGGPAVQLAQFIVGPRGAWPRRWASGHHAQDADVPLVEKAGRLGDDLQDAHRGPPIKKRRHHHGPQAHLAAGLPVHPGVGLRVVAPENPALGHAQAGQAGLPLQPQPPVAPWLCRPRPGRPSRPLRPAPRWPRPIRSGDAPRGPPHP